MKKVFMMFCMAFIAVTTLFGQEVPRMLVVKPVWVTTKTADTDWGGSDAQNNSRYVMTKVEGQDRLYICKIALDVYYKNNKWKNGNEFDPANPKKEGWNDEHYFAAVYQDNYGDIENKNKADAVADAQMFKVGENGTEVTFYAIINENGSIRSFCDAQEVSLSISNNPVSGPFILPAAIGKLSTSTVVEIGETTKKVEVSINNNFLRPDAQPAGGKYAVYSRGLHFVTLDFHTLQYTFSQPYTALSNSGTSTDLVLTGDWTQEAFDAIIAGIDVAKITTIDLTGVNALTDLPSVAGLNPNCLIYVNQGVNISEETNNVVVFNAGEGNAAKVILTEGHDFNNVKPFTAAAASYSRNFSDTGWFTMCLPFSVDKGDMTVEEFTKVEGSELVFANAASFEANVPYLAKTDNPGNKTFEATGATVYPTTDLSPVTPANGYAFYANYQVIEGVEAVGLYLMNNAGTAFAGVAAENPNESSVPAFRAYLQATADRQLAIAHKDGGATDLNSTEYKDRLVIYSNSGSVEIISGKAQSLNLYALDGRLIKALELHEGSNVINGLNKGIYLINHQKVVVK